jgi:hypothetical protein
VAIGLAQQTREADRRPEFEKPSALLAGNVDSILGCRYRHLEVGGGNGDSK